MRPIRRYLPGLWGVFGLGAVVVSATVATATAAAPAPSIVCGTTITAPTATATAAAVVPQVLTGILVVAPTATAAASAPAPSVVCGRIVVVPTATATAAAPTPSIVCGTTTTAPTATATAAAPAPAVLIGTVTVVSTATATAAAPAPSVVYGIGAVAPTATATASAPAPTVIYGSTIAAPTATATASAPAPAVASGSPVIITAVVAAATAQAIAPLVLLSSSTGGIGYTEPADVAAGYMDDVLPVLNAIKDAKCVALNDVMQRDYDTRTFLRAKTGGEAATKLNFVITGLRTKKWLDKWHVRISPGVAWVGGNVVVIRAFTVFEANEFSDSNSFWLSSAGVVANYSLGFEPTTDDPDWLRLSSTEQTGAGIDTINDYGGGLGVRRFWELYEAWGCP